MILSDIDRNVWPFLEGTVLYHGSRGGLSGAIEPVSRPRTDFGRGFYMGSDSLQTKALVFDQQPAFEYSMTVDFASLDDLKVLEVSDVDWAYLILHNRRAADLFNGTQIDLEIGRITDGADFIIGPIADDRMTTAIRLFERNLLTDAGLVACLKSVPYGYQVVARTQRACDAINVITGSPIDDDEQYDILGYTLRNRRLAKNVIDSIAVEYAHVGRRISELLDNPEELQRLHDIPGTADVIVAGETQAVRPGRRR